jgi:hypothetical protein
MIIVEGPDGVGKTTLAKKLARHYKMPLVCFSPLPCWWTIGNYSEWPEYAVYDRFHWSAWAYREVRPQPWDASIKACSAIDEGLRAKHHGNYQTILLYSSHEEWFDDLPEDDMFSRDAVKSVNERFQQVASKFDFTYDVTAEPGAPQYPSLDYFLARGVGKC